MLRTKGEERCGYFDFYVYFCKKFALHQSASEMKHIVAIVASLCAIAGTYAQKVKLLTTEDRLSNSLVNQVYQDRKGYVWIATENGLNRFDGMNINVYHHANRDNVLANDYVHRLFEDSRGRLWVGTLSGLQRYSRKRNNFVDIEMEGGDSKAHVIDFAEDLDGNLWIATSGQGLMKLDYANRRAVKATGIVDGPEGNFISSIIADKTGHIWIVVAQTGVYQYTPSTGLIEQAKIEGDGKLSDNAFITMGNDHIYLSANNSGMYMLDEAAMTFRHVGDVGGTFITAIKENDGVVYIGTDGDGLYTYNIDSKQTEKVDIYTPQLDFKKAKIHSILVDRDKSLWLGIFQKGVILMPHSVAQFETYGYRPNGRNDIGSSSVTAVKRSTDKLWIGTDGDGLYEVRDNSSTIHHTKGLPKIIMSVSEDSDGKLALASYDDGLHIYDPKSGKTEDKNEELDAVTGNYNRRATCLERDKSGKLWMGTYGSGLFVIDGKRIKQHVSTSEEVDYSRNEPINNWINCIKRHGDDMWIGTYNGISRYSMKSERYIDVNQKLREVADGKVIFDIDVDSLGNMWMATASGIVRYNALTKETDAKTIYDGLAANMSVGIKATEDGFVWVGTSGGLSCYNILSKTFSNYYSHDGIQGNQFSRAAVDMDREGRMYFGGTTGVTKFLPVDVKKEDTRPVVEVTNFYLNGREISQTDLSDGQQITDKAVIESDEFRFSFSERTFAFELSTFNYINPEQTYYEYKLEGFDKEWHHTLHGVSQVSFSNLKAGDYELSLKARIGNAESEVKRLRIIIAPLWWQTNWAIAGYFVILAGLMTFIFLAARSRRQIKMEIMRQENERDIEEAKFQFFFNISHEIRTPLTLILNPIKELMSKPGIDAETSKRYDMIFRNSMRITRLINQMLDMRKIDKGQMSVHFKSTDIETCISEVMRNFSNIAEKQNIRLEIENNLGGNRRADVDRDLIEKVMFNLYSNAMKFTPQDGEIITKLNGDSEKIRIEVMDSGCGIDPNKLELIFERFYQAGDNEHTANSGTGIGLHFAKSIVNLHNGAIKAENRTDTKGSILTVELPRKQENAEPADDMERESAKEVKTTAEEIPIFSAEKHRATTNKRVLIVDDEQEVNNYLTTELSKQYKIVSCTNGKDAYDTLHREKIDAVISDVMMPGIDGMTLCHKIKSNPNIFHIPVILLTAKHSDEDRNRGLVMGADAYIAKPFDMTTLKNTLWNIIENRERIMSRMAENSTPAEQKKPFKRIELKSSDEQLMDKVMKYVYNNIADPTLNVEKLSEHVGLSRVHMHRKLKELTNQSARDFIKNIRLKQAGILLGEKKLNISEVAYALGFSNLSHFSTTFKDYYGVSPKEYMNGKLDDGEEETANEGGKDLTE